VKAVFLFSGAFKTYANLIDERGGAGVVAGLRWGLFELSQSQCVNNLQTFVTERKAQRKRRMFNLKYNIKSYPF
jgi:hypothetical protein